MVDGQIALVQGVQVVHWNPERPRLRGRVGRRLPLKRPINNFGDLLGPLVVERLVQQRLGERRASHSSAPAPRLLTVGSIVRLARPGDAVWGTGANGKSLDQLSHVRDLDVRATRGPLTAKVLRDKGCEVPMVFGDPGLLVGRLWTRTELQGSEPLRELTVIPNYRDADRQQIDSSAVTDPRSPLSVCLARIAASSFVTGSSLHAIVVAESLGIPARLIVSDHEPRFKYDDYYLGSGRDGYRAARDVDEALRLGGEDPPVSWDSSALLGAFPFDLWSR